MAEVYALTGSHTAIPVSTSAHARRARLRRWWKAMIAEATAVKMAPPPVEDDVDFLVYGILTLLFVLIVAV